jgi:hypothetical protein
MFVNMVQDSIIYIYIQIYKNLGKKDHHLIPHKIKILSFRVNPMCIQKLSQPSYELLKHRNITNLRWEGIVQPRNTHSRIQTRNLQRTRANRQQFRANEIN